MPSVEPGSAVYKANALPVVLPLQLPHLILVAETIYFIKKNQQMNNTFPLLKEELYPYDDLLIAIAIFPLFTYMWRMVLPISYHQVFPLLSTLSFSPMPPCPSSKQNYISIVTSLRKPKAILFCRLKIVSLSTQHHEQHCRCI